MYVGECGASRIQADFLFAQLVNLALQQNSRPLVDELKLKNCSGRDLKNLNCTFFTEPELTTEKRIHIEALADEEELVIPNIAIELKYEILTLLSSPLNGKLIFEIKEEDKIVLHEEHNLTAYPANQCLGFQFVPELLASFVTPNMEVVSVILNMVSFELEKATGSPEIQGYQQDKERVYSICEAIYRAVHSLGINYSNPPASFGQPGQKIRFADEIYKYRLGCCLDLTILFASIMEQCGLHPVIMLEMAHAYIGCHLREYYFPDVPIDDLQKIRKLVDLDEFVVIETTCVTTNTTFAKAEIEAREKHLKAGSEFQCAIDIVRARFGKIRPLPLVRSIDGIEFKPEVQNGKQLESENRRQLREEVDLYALNNRTRVGRIDRWRKKLLDLSLRNRLLNVRDIKQIIGIACPNIGLLEDKMATYQNLSLGSLDTLLGEKEKQDRTLLQTVRIEDELKTLLEKELLQCRLWTQLSESELEKRLKGLYRQSKTNVEEGGVNSLFLGIGLLEWTPLGSNPIPCKAPILLVPVKLQRKSMAEGIRIIRLDEDTAINMTLLERLRSEHSLNIPGLDPLPTDDYGVDTKKVLQIIKQTIIDMKGWEVHESVCLGLFPFSKFIMLNDMTNRIDTLKSHPLVEHLINGEGAFDDGVYVFPQEEVDKNLDLSNLFSPLNADFSQLAAIKYSEMGKNFVLHGPPGTGKSQTISNIIAHNLALGRKVLFVSEKKAALDVVYNRLSSIGLKPFCLELHSNKSGKAEVMKQFSEALEIPETSVPDNWSKTVAELIQLRNELNEHIKYLHYEYPNGLSIYQCFSYQLNNPNPASDALINIDCLTHSHEAYNASCKLFENIASTFSAITAQAHGAFCSLKPLEWSPQLEEKLLSETTILKDSIKNVVQSFRKVAVNFGLDLENLSQVHVYRAVLLSKAIKNIIDIPAVLITKEVSESIKFLNDYCCNALKVLNMEEKLEDYNLETLSKFDYDKIEQCIGSNQKKFFLLRFFSNRSLLAELAQLKKIGTVKLTINELSSIIPELRIYSKLHSIHVKNTQQAELLLGQCWKNEKQNWNELKQFLKKLEELYEIIRDCTNFSECIFENILNRFQNISSESNSDIKKTNIISETENLLNEWNIFQNRLHSFTLYISEIEDQANITLISNQLENILCNREELRAALIYLKCRDQAFSLGYEKIVETLENGTVAPKEISSFFKSAYIATMLKQALEKSPAIGHFLGTTHDQRVNRFRALDCEYLTLSKEIVFSKLAEKLPLRRSGPCPMGTELGLLKRECEKRTRRKPVRLLLAEIPNLALTLKPCFLMSPLSVAQYLPSEIKTFDMIIFDEASQIPVWDAVGAIARGKQLIVVGDPKQLPPTSFFERADSPEDEVREEEEVSKPINDDMESILDELKVAGIFCVYLNWHYRSRHESLISFSNHHYYKNRLSTFPAAKDEEMLGVRFRFVSNGVFDRSASRTNENEASVLVNYLFERLKNPKLRDKSVGIVTFNQSQKNLIEDIIEKKRSQNPQLENFFNEQNEESFFVKNLENVQGDERDVILFSVTYGPDNRGKLSMNFGPLNQQGGERRLNVAITRAKEQVVVFSSIHSDQIDLNRTSAIGAAHLKYFLDYAEKGTRLHYDSPLQTDNKDGLINSVGTFLKDNGFHFKTYLGCSDYRIALALIHPDKPETYLLGIEFDGPTYKREHTARDRDHLRHDVLQSLGWQMYRVWSTDWILARKHAQAQLLHAIEEAKEMQEKNQSIPPLEHEPLNTSEETKPNIPPKREHLRYRIWNNPVGGPQELFYEYGSRQIIRNQMNEIIETESPIYKSLMQKRVADAWGFKRIGGQISDILDSCLADDFIFTKHGEEKVYWKKNAKPDQFFDFRVPAEGDEKRSISQIPPEELASAMREILSDFHSCEKDVLYRETLKLFGLSFLTEKARKYLDCGMHLFEKMETPYLPFKQQTD